MGIKDIVPIYSYAAAFKHVCDIATFVSITDQRSGIGRKLMAAAKKQAIEKGNKKPVAMIRADNASRLS